jgi:TfoX/Sxy family transcriptional regulator of competence genes
MTTSIRPAVIRDTLTALAPVRMKKLFGSDAFFHGERMFAVLGNEALMLRLPEPLRTETLLTHSARPFLSEHLALTHGWVEVPYSTELVQLTRLAQGAHAAAGRRARKVVKRRFRRAARR